MESAEFKKIFNEIAVKNGFEKAYEGWFKDFPEIILVLDLQKSNYRNFYYLNIKLFIQGIFDKKYIKSKKLVKIEVGNIFLRQPNNYSFLLDLDAFLSDQDRKESLIKMFDDFINPFIKKTNSKEAIKDYHKNESLFILPAVKQELDMC